MGSSMSPDKSRVLRCDDENVSCMCETDLKLPRAEGTLVSSLSSHKDGLFRLRAGTESLNDYVGGFKLGPLRVLVK